MLEKSRYEAQINDILKLSVDKIYQNKEVVEKEIAGYSIIGDLLEVFVNAVNNTFENKASNYDKLILLLLPENYKTIPDSLYGRIMNICNLIANYSDGNAILLHKKINGVNLG